MGLESVRPGRKVGQIDSDQAIQKLQLSDRLGLTTDVDRTLLSLCFFARLLRNPSSRRADLLAHPLIPALRTWPIMGHMIQRLEVSEVAHQATVTETEFKLRKFVEENYPSPEARNRAREIELAVNELVAKSLARGDSLSRGKPTLLIVMEDLDTWGKFWKPRVTAS